MKTTLLILAALTATLRAQSSGPYTLDWSTVDGGGITLASTGGGYTLSGTTGQADAAPVSRGGGFEITGGFWSVLIVLSVPDAPELTLQPVAGGSRVMLSWDVSSSGWSVEVSADMEKWSPAPAGIVDTLAAHTVTLPAVQRMFFRLRRIP